MAIINWSTELVDAFASKLYPLWNRTAGDCLLDSVLQATWGVVDRDSTLRRSMADSLVDGASRCVHILVNMVAITYQHLLSAVFTVAGKSMSSDCLSRKVLCWMRTS